MTFKQIMSAMKADAHAVNSRLSEYEVGGTDPTTREAGGHSCIVCGAPVKKHGNGYVRKTCSPECAGKAKGDTKRELYRK